MRETFLESLSWNLVGRLGPRAFRGISGEIVSVSLTILSMKHPDKQHQFQFIDAFDGLTASDKEHLLASERPSALAQRQLRLSPASRIGLGSASNFELLREYAESRTGTRTADNLRLLHNFWEHKNDTKWRRLQSVPDTPSEFAGREQVLLWEDGNGALSALAASGHASIQGRDAWGRGGVCLGLTGALKATLYAGEIFDMNCGVVWPRNQADLPALWAFLSDPSYHDEVRVLDQQLKLTTKTLVEVPFDVERWRKVAAEEFPDGLPEPWSDDATQWLFEGRPDVAQQPLHVGVGRLLGFRWPEQADTDDLDTLADDDGIVCLPSVFGEQARTHPPRSTPRAQAFGDTWTPTRTTELLVAVRVEEDRISTRGCGTTGSKITARCSRTGPSSGTSGTAEKTASPHSVSYHLLDRTNLERLTYTYLGDWIERQQAAVTTDTAGAEERLAAALGLQHKLELILDGEEPYDIFRSLEDTRRTADRLGPRPE